MIIKRRNQDWRSDKEYFDIIAKDNSYEAVSLADLWEDTKVDELYIHKSCIVDIDKWVRNSLGQIPVPEVAGFLLGKYTQEDTLSMKVSIEKFIPAENVKFNNKYRIDFGSQTLVEMDSMKQSTPDLILVGWFHTHPGHGPFLSETDLYSHNWAFKHPYQLAIVLDSLTEGFFTGIFSKREDGTVNNRPSGEKLKKGLYWGELLKKHYEE